MAEEVQHASRNADSVKSACIDSNTKKGPLSQQFVTHVAPPMGVGMGVACIKFPGSASSLVT